MMDVESERETVLVQRRLPVDEAPLNADEFDLEIKRLQLSFHSTQTTSFRMNYHYKDPNKELPPELSCHLIALLPPASRARSSASCKDWRTNILSDPSLHRDVDLSSLGASISQDKIIGYLNHLSSLSNHQLVDVSLNLSSCWFDAKRQSEWNSTGLCSAFRILLRSKETL